MGEAILWMADRGSRNPGDPSDLPSSFRLFPKNETEHSCLAKSLEFWSRSRTLLCAWKDGVFPRAFAAQLARPTHAQDPGHAAAAPVGPRGPKTWRPTFRTSV